MACPGRGRQAHVACRAAEREERATALAKKTAQASQFATLCQDPDADPFFLRLCSAGVGVHPPSTATHCHPPTHTHTSSMPPPPELEPFLLLARSARGRAAAELVLKATAAPGVFVFGELLDEAHVREV